MFVLYLLLALLLFRFVCFVFLLFFHVSVFLKIDIGKIHCISFWLTQLTFHFLKEVKNIITSYSLHVFFTRRSL